MNGRVYDPVTGRFLSPDPYIQNPYNGQNFDRYSYCLNNPLKYVDPSGYLISGNGPGFAHWWYILKLKIKRGASVLMDDPFDDPLSSWGGFYNYGTSGGGGGGGGAPLGGNAASGPGTGGGGGGGTSTGTAYPSKINFSKANHRDQIKNTFKWVNDNSTKIWKPVLIDNLVDFNSLKNSPYYERMYSFGVSAYGSLTCPSVVVQNPGTNLVMEVRCYNNSNLGISYKDKDENTRTIIYTQPSELNGDIRIVVSSYSTEKDGTRDSGISVKFDISDPKQLEMFKIFNASMGGLYVQKK